DLSVWNGNSTRHLITLLFVRLAKEFELSKSDCLSFLFLLEKTQHKNPFATRNDLELWLSGTYGFMAESAVKILEESDKTEKVLRKLAMLLGMNRILRNVGRDWRLYDRVLLPLSSLEQYELERNLLWNRRHSWQWHEYIHDEVERFSEQKRE